MNRIVFILILTAFTFRSTAQKVDTNYIQRFPSYLIISPYINTAAVSFNIEPRISVIDSMSTYRTVNYKPNIKGGYGFDLSYRVFDLSIGFRQKLDKTTEFLYGQTSYSKIGFRLWATRNLMTEVKFQRYQGFANMQTPSYDSASVPDGTSPFQYRPDIVLTYFKVRGIYQMNPYKFSMRSSFSFSERQRRRAGGWLFSAHIYGLSFKGDSSFVPADIYNSFGNSAGIKTIQVQSLGISPGYGGTLTRGRFFVTAIVFIGMDLQHFTYDMPGRNKPVNEVRLVTMTDFRTAVGYNNRRLFFGVETTLDYNVLGMRAFKGSFSGQRVLFSFGYRFNTPRILDKTYKNAVNRFIPENYRKWFW